MDVVAEREPWDGIEKAEHLCSVPGCGISGEDEEWGLLLYIHVLTSAGQEGYAEVTQAFCEDHFAIVTDILRMAGFKSHRHGGINFLEEEEPTCGGYGKCPTPSGYGRELVQPKAPDHIAPLLDLIGKLAEVTFEQGREGGGHDLGLWLDSGELTEQEHQIVVAALEKTDTS